MVKGLTTKARTIKKEQASCLPFFIFQSILLRNLLKFKIFNHLNSKAIYQALTPAKGSTYTRVCISRSIINIP